MPGWKFELDHAGIGEYLRTDAELAAAVHDRARVALEFAQSVAPVGDPPDDEHPGRYRDGLDVGAPAVETTTVRGRPDSRLGCRLGSDAAYALAVEKRHHVLARTRTAFTDPKGGPGL